MTTTSPTTRNRTLPPTPPPHPQPPLYLEETSPSRATPPSSTPSFKKRLDIVVQDHESLLTESLIANQISPLIFSVKNFAETQREFFSNDLINTNLTWDNPNALTSESIYDSFTSARDAIEVTDCEDALPLPAAKPKTTNQSSTPTKHIFSNSRDASRHGGE